MRRGTIVSCNDPIAANWSVARLLSTIMRYIENACLANEMM